MSDSDIRRGNEKGRAAVLGSFQDDDLDAASSSGEFYRLLGIPALAAVLFVGGVYWIRMQVPAGSPGQQSAAVVQVQLLPRPEAVPIAVAPVSQPDTANVASRADTSLKDPDPTPSDDPVPAPRARTVSPGDTPPMPAAVSGPASSAAVKFQQTLLRHVSRYQRYPKAASAMHLEGKVVDTQFAMARDGTLLGVWVRTSSGQLLLDKEAIETIRRAQPLPPIPPELPDRLNIHLELEF
ncbi:TonB family protein [Bradyrhizobium sp. CB1717]|uniref:TonB family protein n=2 Tax=unclassified Bradyrhizobium TaxID=2631580 RepID=UPI0024B1FB73|nr:TonB family protein [Bradyrhizobium sp. CB1717]WFU22141.1 TonB family protein [Bradyrhizobium sp. CB1717]